MKNSGCYVVSWDFTNGQDNSVAIVGEQNDKEVKVINAFQGKEAEELIKKLTKKEKK